MTINERKEIERLYRDERRSVANIAHEYPELSLQDIIQVCEGVARKPRPSVRGEVERKRQ